jgi:hypothetical protein
MRTQEIIEANMKDGFTKSRSVALSWAVADFMAYCYDQKLSFEHVLKMAKKTFKWQISYECVKCRGKISPDDHKEGEGYCPGCMPEEGAKA